MRAGLLAGARARDGVAARPPARRQQRAVQGVVRRGARPRVRPAGRPRAVDAQLRPAPHHELRRRLPLPAAAAHGAVDGRLGHPPFAPAAAAAARDGAADRRVDLLRGGARRLPVLPHLRLLPVPKVRPVRARRLAQLPRLLVLLPAAVPPHRAQRELEERRAARAGVGCVVTTRYDQVNCVTRR
ncbi:MAG: hypothetical protein CL848_04900 [Crocinitomicaceae bacterium]|nr:hypothetical protein [Crocinitomicaceae bacterium]